MVKKKKVVKKKVTVGVEKKKTKGYSKRRHGSLTKAGKVRSLHKKEWRIEQKRERGKYTISKIKRRKNKHLSPRIKREKQYSKLKGNTVLSRKSRSF